MSCTPFGKLNETDILVSMEGQYFKPNEEKKIQSNGALPPPFLERLV